MSKTYKLLNKEYINKFGNFDISYDKTGDITLPYIYTDRFFMSPLISKHKHFNDYSSDIQQLYNVTFGDENVMEKYYNDGKPIAIEKFEEIVNRSSCMWEHQNPFAWFIITDNENNKVVGCQIIANTNINKEPILDTARIAYLFNKDYHRSNIIQGVGLECVTALDGYGKSLFDRESLVNQIYNDTTNKFEGGTILKKLFTYVRRDNIPSLKILLQLGFRSDQNQKAEYDDKWYKYYKNYETD